MRALRCFPGILWGVLFGSLSPVLVGCATLPGPIAHALEGSVATGGSVRLREDPLQDRLPLAEVRTSLSGRAYWSDVQLNSEVHGILHAGVLDEPLDLRRGFGVLDVRELNGGIRILDIGNLKIGRQVINWGVGDLLSVNDVFPKDLRSVILGRGESLLNAPTDALRLALGRGSVNLDLAYVPVMVPDRFVDGRAISYWNPILGGPAGQEGRLKMLTIESFPNSDEWAVRIYGFWNSREWSFFLTDGMTHSPSSITVEDGEFGYLRQRSVGVSLRGSIRHAVVFAEAAAFGREAPLGTVGLMGDENRLLVGLSYPLPGSVEAGFQGYWEKPRGVGAFWPGLAIPRPKARSVFTCRISRMFMSDELRMSLFALYSPSADDHLVFHTISSRLRHDFRLEAGYVLIGGSRVSSPLGQYDLADNLYARLTWFF